MANKEYENHVSQLQRIKRSKTPLLRQEYQINRHKQHFENDSKLLDIYKRNKQIAFNLAQIHSKSQNKFNNDENLELIKSRSKALMNINKRKQLAILDENLFLCKRIISQPSRINFRGNLEKYQFQQNIKQRLLKYKRPSSQNS
ncbi:hypothetical protein pb186bvf_014013 [Paramecium bursaria]